MFSIKKHLLNITNSRRLTSVAFRNFSPRLVEQEQSFKASSKRIIPTEDLQNNIEYSGNNESSEHPQIDSINKSNIDKKVDKLTQIEGLNEITEEDIKTNMGAIPFEEWEQMDDKEAYQGPIIKNGKVVRETISFIDFKASDFYKNKIVLDHVNPTEEDMLKFYDRLKYSQNVEEIDKYREMKADPSLEFKANYRPSESYYSEEQLQELREANNSEPNIFPDEVEQERLHKEKFLKHGKITLKDLQEIEKAKINELYKFNSHINSYPHTYHDGYEAMEEMRRFYYDNDVFKNNLPNVNETSSITLKIVLNVDSKKPGHVIRGMSQLIIKPIVDEKICVITTSDYYQQSIDAGADIVQDSNYLDSILEEDAGKLPFKTLLCTDDQYQKVLDYKDKLNELNILPRKSTGTVVANDALSETIKSLKLGGAIYQSEGNALNVKVGTLMNNDHEIVNNINTILDQVNSQRPNDVVGRFILFHSLKIGDKEFRIALPSKFAPKLKTISLKKYRNHKH